MIVDDLILLAILATHMENPHCFVRGCGQETFSHWVWRTTGVCIDPKMLKRYMHKLVSQRIFYPGKSRSNYRTYILTKRGINLHLTKTNEIDYMLSTKEARK